MTNGDKIRGMGNNGILDFFEGFIGLGCANCLLEGDCNGILTSKECRGAIRKWLESEAE